MWITQGNAISLSWTSAVCAGLLCLMEQYLWPSWVGLGYAQKNNRPLPIGEGYMASHKLQQYGRIPMSIVVYMEGKE